MPQKTKHFHCWKDCHSGLKVAALPETIMCDKNNLHMAVASRASRRITSFMRLDVWGNCLTNLNPTASEGLHIVEMLSVFAPGKWQKIFVADRTVQAFSAAAPGRRSKEGIL